MNRRDLTVSSSSNSSSMGISAQGRPRVGTLSAGTSKEKLNIKIMVLERLINEKKNKKSLFMYVYIDIDVYIFKKIMKYTQT